MNAPVVIMQAAAKVSIETFISLVGHYSVDAIRKKIQRGVWREGKEYEKAPDGHIFILLEGFYKWVGGKAEAA